jgi:hypothetical protein
VEVDQTVSRGVANSGKEDMVLFRCMLAVYLRRYNVRVMDDRTQSSYLIRGICKAPLW